jgi:uncharacterized protein YjiS (DUF1127 family)
MQLERKSRRTVIANHNHRLRGWEGEPLDLVEALPPFMFKSEPPMIDDDHGGWLKVALFSAISNIMEGFALYGASMHPEIYHAFNEDGRVPKRDKDLLPTQQLDRLESSIFPLARTLGPIRHPPSTKERIDRLQRRGCIGNHPVDLDECTPIEPVRNNSTGWRAQILSIPTKPWRGLSRVVETRRTQTTLEAMDDHTLKDIGLSRHDIDVVARNGRRLD